MAANTKRLKTGQVPFFLAIAILLGGINNVVTGLLAIFQFHGWSGFYAYAKLSRALNLEQSSHVVAIIIGVFLIFLGRGLLKQKRSSWQLAMWFLTLSLANASFPPPEWHTFILSAVFIFLLFWYRNQFFRQEVNNLHYQRMVAFFTVVFAVAYGTVGSYLMRADYQHIHTWIDALYYTFATYSTVGYGDIVPITAHAKMFTISMIVIGIGSFVTTLSVVLGPIFQKNIRGVYKMVVNLASLNGHVLLCGDNLLTRELAKKFMERGRQVFFLESDDAKKQSLEQVGFNVMQVDPEDEEQLGTIGLHKAHCLVSAYPDDSKNIIIMMSANHVRQQKKKYKTKLTCRVDEPHNADKARRAGADQIISPLLISAYVVLGELS